MYVLRLDRPSGPLGLESQASPLFMTIVSSMRQLLGLPFPEDQNGLTKLLTGFHAKGVCGEDPDFPQTIGKWIPTNNCWRRWSCITEVLF